MFIATLAVVFSSALAAQSVPRADLPRSGSLRVTFEPQIHEWDQEISNGLARPLGWFLSGQNGTLAGARTIPQLARLQQDMRLVTGDPNYLAILGAARLSLQAERRDTPILLELGVTDRLAIGVRVPLVRVQMRAGLTLDSTAGNLGRNPRTFPGTADSDYETFFTQFDAVLTQIQDNITAGSYGPPGSGTRAAAQAFADSATAVRGALYRATYGASGADAAPFLPTATSFAGVALDNNVTRIQQRFVAGFGVVGFTQNYLLPDDRVSVTDVSAILLDPNAGFGATPIQDTRRALRYWLGDVELQARYGLVKSRHYAATVGALVRLPTGHQESAHNFFDLSTGDHQLDLEAELTQEAIVGSRLWLNAAVRLGRQQAGTRQRRVGPPGAVLLPAGTAALLDWDPGDYIALDAAPLYRFTPQFAVGLTAGYYTQSRDRYTYRSATDSLAVAAALGAPTAAGVLDVGTAFRHGRLGSTVTFAAANVEGSLSIERVITARGAAVPSETRFRIVMRTSLQLF